MVTLSVTSDQIDIEREYDTDSGIVRHCLPMAFVDRDCDYNCMCVVVIGIGMVFVNANANQRYERTRECGCGCVTKQPTLIPCESRQNETNGRGDSIIRFDYYVIQSVGQPANV